MTAHGGTNIVAYASRSLTDCESRYSQTEREALAVVWGIEHFHLYLYGSSFQVIKDHKPLETIFNNPPAKQLRDLKGYSRAYSHTKPKSFTSQEQTTQLIT